MKVFISWSGEVSHIVGLALKDWLPSVIQCIDPFISSEDIAKGSRWSSVLETELNESKFGIICLTPENHREPWILFEAGALSRGIGETFVAPLLTGMTIPELEGPLAQFNASIASKDDIFKLLISINDRIDTSIDRKLEPRQLENIFEALWTGFETRINECLAKLITIQSATHEDKVKRSADDMLEELIELNRNNSRMLIELPSRVQTQLHKESTELYDKRFLGPVLESFLLHKDIFYKHAKLTAELEMLITNIAKVRAELEQISHKTTPTDYDITRIEHLKASLSSLEKDYAIRTFELKKLDGISDIDQILKD